ncbi:hypothetical protein, partial [Kitasatospora sp. NPDC005748]|uniref:hypothetical protein n=1 Tax=Kitasatospora sp. NPDC005748 TaxID=3157063 RepID=UPI0033EDEE44
LERDLAGNPHQVLVSGDFNAGASMRDLDGLRAPVGSAPRGPHLRDHPHPAGPARLGLTGLGRTGWT